MASVRSAAALAALLALLLTCHAAPPVQDASHPTEEAGAETTVTIAPAPTGPTPPPEVIDVQEQIYIITGIFLAFTIFLLGVTLVSAYVIIGLRHKIKRLESGEQPSPAPRRKPTHTRRPTPGPAPARENRAFAPDDDDDDDDLRSYHQYPESHRERAHSLGERPYDRFHKPMPDSYLPSEDAGRGRRDDHSNSRYGAGNLARLPKGPAPQPPLASYDGRYPDERSRRPQSHGHW